MEHTDIHINNGVPRPHHRVLKPPGGGSHDIFGTGMGQMADSSNDFRRVKYQESSIVIGSNEAEVTPPRSGTASPTSPTNGTANAAAGLPSTKPGNFGQLMRGEENECDSNGSPERKAKDHMKSTVFGDSHGQGMASVTGIPRRPQVSQAPYSTSYDCLTATPSSRSRRGGGNPITGEGYVNGTPKQAGECDSPRGRNPPGGHSQMKLW